MRTDASIFTNTIATTATPLYRPKLESPDTLAPRIVRDGEGKTYQFPCDGITATSLLRAEDTDAFSLLSVGLESGAVLPLHVRRNEDVIFHSLDSTFSVQRGDELLTLSAGTAVRIPRGVCQSLTNTGDHTGHLLLIVSPGGFERYCEAVDAALNLHHDSSDTSLAHREALMNGHGMEMLAPSAPTLTEGRPVIAGPLVDLGDHRSHTLISSEETDGKLLFADVEADPDGGVPPHIHRREDEVFYMLGGSATFTIGDSTIEARPGDCLFAPRDVMHTWRNNGTVPCSLLILFSPGANFEPFAYQMAQILRQAENAKIGPDTHPTLFGQMMALFHRYGVEPLPPNH